MMSFEGEDAGAAFFGAAADPPEKNEAIDLCMKKQGSRGGIDRNILMKRSDLFRFKARELATSMGTDLRCDCSSSDA